MNTFKHSATALAIAACLGLSVPAYADNSSGSIYGNAAQGTTITIKNVNTGLTRQIVANADGKFNFRQLPVGVYEVSDGNSTFQVNVAIDTGSSVIFSGEAAETIMVRGSRISAIDTSSVEATTVFTQDQIQNLPVARDITDVALLAPGTTQGDSGFGNLASFGGASVAENGYYINGFDVTNIRTFLSFADLPFDAIAQQQIKTGGYSAEYGRALGGVINLVTKSGTNDWEFGGAIYYSPSSLYGRRNDSASTDPDDAYDFRFHRYNSANEFDSLSYNIYGGGPIIEDKLFIFGMFEGQKERFNDFNREISDKQEYSSPQGLVKVDYYLTDDHIFEFTGIFNEQDEDNIEYANPDGVYYSDRHYEETARYTDVNGGKIGIAKYTGHLTDDLSVSALYGYSSSKIENRVPGVIDPAAAECPRVFDSRANASQVVQIGCWLRAQTFIPDPEVEADKDVRKSLKFSVDYSIGDHDIKIGYDHETYDSSFQGQVYTGGIYYRYFTVPDSRSIGGSTDHSLDPGDTYVRTWNRGTLSGSFEVENTALYIEDNWQLNEDMLVYLGLRQETFSNFNGEGEVFVEADDLIAPRLGFSWDIDGDSTKKFFMNLGRYYIPIASNTNIRASNAEPFVIRYWEYDGIDPVTAAPVTLGTQIAEAVVGEETPPNPATIADKNLKPMHQDELIIGYQQALSQDWSLGVRGIYRKIQDGMDDFCSPGGFIDWAEDQGFDDFDWHTLAPCMIINPGNDLTFDIDVNNDGNLQEHTVPNSYFNLPKYEREYKALELFWEKAASDGLYLQGSYTLAKGEGNAEGYVNSTLEQEDPGLTQDFDHSRFMDGAYGPLPNDRRHTFKLFGAYELNEEITLSGNLLIQSGRPINCNGFVPLDGLRQEDADNLQGYGSSAFYCLNPETAQSELSPRGSQGRTPWLYNVNVGLGYRPMWADGLTLRVDIQNVFDLDTVTEFDETGDATRDAPNANYGVATNWQTPRRVRFSLRYNF